MNLMRFFTILLLFILTQSVYSESQNKTRYVLIRDGFLNLRDQPENGKVIGKLKKGEPITLTEDAEGIDWLEVKTKSGQKGFVSSEFVGVVPPNKLSDVKLLGFISQIHPEKKDEHIGSILGLQIGGKWYGSDQVTSEYIYLGKEWVSKKEVLKVTAKNNVNGSFEMKGNTNWGCQNIKGYSGKLTGSVKAEEEHLLTYGFKDVKALELKKLKANNPLSEALKKRAVDIFSKNSIPKDQIHTMTMDDIVLFENPINKSSYISGRFAIKKEHAEKHYAYILAKIVNKKPDYIFEKIETLSDEVGAYGGSFHLSWAISLDSTGKPLLIFTDIGFDAHVYSVYTIEEDELKLLFSGAGDAC